MILDWFLAGEAKRFGTDLARFLLQELSTTTHKTDAKFAVKAEKVLIQADRRVRQFTARERMNVYKKGKLANAFLWTLKDGGCPADYAKQLTEWLSFRL
jgi:hypothetical protein